MNHHKYKRRLSVLVCGFAFVLVSTVGVKAQVHRSENTVATPEAQAVKVYQAIRDLDFRALYFLFALSPAAKKQMPLTADEFARQMRSGYEGGNPEQTEVISNMFHSIKDIGVGKAVITANKALVPTWATITVKGSSYKFAGNANMIKDDGVWKLDLTYTDDLETATSEQTAALLGKPVDPQP